MSRTDIDPATLAKALRQMAGDGSIEWVCEPMQTRVLLDVADLLDESASLRDRITTQKQTIQAYRDESREWREVAEHAQAENAKLRELVLDAWGDGHPDRSCDGCDIRDECHDDLERMRKDGVWRFTRCLFELRIEERMRELGIEVSE